MNFQTDFRGMKVAILTSGGDSQGMNAAIRSCGRMILSQGARMFVIRWGYQGLVDGGESIKEYFWNDFSKIIYLGGTTIGSARCQDFMTPEGRRRACLNLVTIGINKLVIIGGDGSLTGANIFRTEWPSHLEALQKEGKIKEEQAQSLQHLSIVGMVGSIDNDFCGTDTTIGTNSALHRIIECVDAIITTAESHQRAFIVEVMGRHSGYLALSAGISVGADFVFIPEYPLDTNWKEILCHNVTTFRKKGKKYTIVLVAEGAQDKAGTRITSEQVKTTLEKCTNLEARVTVLGHIQRGGSPSAYDRILATRQGIEAAINVLVCKPEDPSYVICTEGNNVCRRVLNECITKCNLIKTSYKENNVQQVAQLRGKSFLRNLALFTSLQGITLNETSSDAEQIKIGIVHSGSPSAGMDACTRAFTLWCISKGYKAVGFKSGFEGMSNGDYINLEWNLVQSWFTNGGSSLGSTRAFARDKIGKIANVIKELGIKGLVVVGGFDCLFSLRDLHESKADYQLLRIPIIMIPAAFSNNIPCTSYCLGSDTTLNVITQCCDSLRMSAHSSRRRIFVVETFGKKCGYLATMSAVASAADNSYSFQNTPSIYDILKDIEIFKEKFIRAKLDFGLLMVSDNFNENYNTQTITQLLNEEGKPHFIGLSSVIGHIQQGATASPFDRFLGAKFGSRVAEKMIDMIAQGSKDPDFLMQPESCCMICLTPDGYVYKDYLHLLDSCSKENRHPLKMWWLPMLNILNILSSSDYVYESITVPNVIMRRVK